MALIKVATLCLLVAVAVAQNFDDYDYQDIQNQQQQQAQQRPVRPPPRPQGPIGGSRGFSGPTTTRAPPVAILKQINRHNDDGSYTYGYEGADGSFKIETKLVTGEVMGKYGYVDENGKQKTVEYGANRYGFQPVGEGITVPPPTLVDETTRRGPNGEIVEYVDDGSYFDADAAPRPVARPASRAKAGRPRPQPQPTFDQVYEAPRPQPQQSPAPVPPRAVVPGAGPVPPRASIPGAIQSGPIFRSAPPSGPAFRPAPQQSFAPRPAIQQPAPQQSYSAPRQVPQQSYAPRPAPVREHRPSQSGLLDDLAQQYSLPQNSGSQPLTDISFGSYSSQTHF